MQGRASTRRTLPSRRSLSKDKKKSPRCPGVPDLGEVQVVAVSGRGQEVSRVSSTASNGYLDQGLVADVHLCRKIRFRREGRVQAKEEWRTIT